MKKIHISPSLALPVDVVTESIAILAIKRVGKSITAKKLFEQLHHADQQVGTIDPKGDWWGVLSSADGKRPGLPVLIFGGDHGHVPIEPSSGELVAQLVVRERVSFVIDTSGLSKGKTATFMADFLETLYMLKAKDEYRTPMMLFIDEADAIAPQKPQANEARMLGAAEDIVRRGGQRGLGVCLITQRTAVLNKNVLTQCGVLFLLRTTGSQDFDAIDDWIKKHGNPERRAQVLAELASLPKGTAWVWAPGWPDEHGIFQRVPVDMIETFDSGRTPKPGEKPAKPKTAADVDLGAFRTAMAETIERVKASDPTALRARVKELEAQLAKSEKRAPLPAPKAKVLKVPVLTEAQVRGFEKGVQSMLERLEEVKAAIPAQVEAMAKTVDRMVRDYQEWVQRVNKMSAVPPALLHSPIVLPESKSFPQMTPARAARVAKIAEAEIARNDGSAPSLSAGERAILTVLVQYMEGRTKNQLATLTGYSAGAGGFNNFLGVLRVRGEVQGYHPAPLTITQRGLEVLGPYEELPTGDELLTYWRAKLSAGEGAILGVLRDAYPGSLSKQQIADATNYAPGAGRFNNLLGHLRTLELVSRGEEIRLSPLLVTAGS